MTTPSPAFQAHLDRDVTTLCYCWKLTRRDGVVLGFTDHDRPLTVGATLYEPDTGLTASETRSSLGLAEDSQQVEGALSSPRITEADIAAGRYDGASVETLLVNWRAPEQHLKLRRATIGGITREDGRFTAELSNLSASLDRVVGRTIRRTCDAELGDARCGVDLDTESHTASAAVLGDEGMGGLRVGGLGGFAPGWFSHGVLEAASGAAAGLTARIVDHRVAGGEVRLVLSGELVGLATGDAVIVRAGCDKRFATCRDKFANALNFRGFPHLPGNDAAYTYVNADQTFDGGAIVS